MIMDVCLTVVAGAYLVVSYWRHSAGDTWGQAVFWPLRVIRRR